MFRDGHGLRRVLVPLSTLFTLSLGAAFFAGMPRAAEQIPFSASRSQGQLSQFPRIILWAWEHPADLHFIDPKNVGVAFLASTIYLPGNDVVIRPRLQPLNVPLGTSLMATVRIETNQTRRQLAPPVFSINQRGRVAEAIAEAAGLPAVKGVQIDFDATLSERPFYRNLLEEVHRRLPDGTPLSVTALASWCAGDQWMDGLPIDEAVPMLFRMGADRTAILSGLREGHNFAAALCNQSVGISTDEPINVMSAVKRVYIFHPGSWSRQSVREAMGGTRE